MAGQIPPQLQKAISRRVGMKKASMTNAPPRAGNSQTNTSKVATFKAPGFQKSNVLQKMQGADAEVNDTGSSGPQAFIQNTKGNKSQQNSKAIIARRLQKKK